MRLAATRRRRPDRIARDYALELVTDWPIRALGVHCAVFRIGGERPVEDVMRDMAGDARVDGVQRMNGFRALHSRAGDRHGPDSGAIELTAAHRLSTGRNVRIAVVDTGIDIHHPDLAGQVVETRDLVTDSETDHDDVHGTAVAGVIAARAENREGIVGVAPGAKLMALRACWPDGPDAAGASCNTLTLARALDAVVQLKPDVLNLSLAGPADPLLAALLNAVMEAGIVVVVAAPPAQSVATGFPAGVVGVIEVASIHALAADEAAALVRAPGTDVLTTFPHGSYDFISGNSFAAAHVSGVVALLLELHPGMKAAEVLHLLLARDRDAAHGSPRAETSRDGAGLRAASDERVCALMSRLGRTAGCAPPSPVRRPRELSGNSQSMPLGGDSSRSS